MWKTIMKQKPKELVEERDEIVRLITLCNDGNVNITEEKYSKVKNYLTQQRTEIESQKVKVVWNNVCEQIKRETVEETTGKVLSLATEKLIDLQTTNCSWKVIKWDDLFNIIKSIDNLQIKKGK
jgi:hypothetical protein